MSKPPNLYVCLYAREFPAQAMLRLRPDMRSQPLVIMDGEPPMQTVCSCDAKARSLGVVLGMTQVEVGTIPAITSTTRSRSEEEAAISVLLECAGTFSPRVENRSQDNAFLCVIDIAGTEKLFGSSEKLVKALIGRVRALGVVAVAAVSEDFNTSLCIARSMNSSRPISVVPSGKEAEALSSIPLTVLGLNEKSAETFALWGIRTLGMLAALPETSLIARMGQEGKRHLQLARGKLPHLFLPSEPPFKLEEHRELDFPEDNLESLLFGVNVMLEQLMIRAVNRALALASVTTMLTLDGGVIHSRTVKPALPSIDKQLWLKLIQLDLEAHPPGAAILALTLNAEPGNIGKVQLGLFSPQLPEAARLDVTLARIRAIVGEDRVGRAVLKDTHRSDDFRMEPFTVPSGRPAVSMSNHKKTAMRQLRPAEKLTVSTRDEQPETFFFRGKRYVVERAYGPWRASGDWWSGSRWKLEQWDFISRSGEERLCCCAVHDLEQGLWTMEGLYD